MHYGGIYLDNDVYLVKSLNEFRKFEMVLSIERNWIIGNQVLIAHKNARFLKAVYDSYRTRYNASSWYYNGGVVPGEILQQNPKLAKIVPEKFGK
jgi:mannosyltransferase OCH1-like enzyme